MKLKIIIYCIFASLITYNANGAAIWVETDMTEAEILHELQDKILHIATTTFSSRNNDLLTTIVTYEGTFRCATVLPQKAGKYVNSITEDIGESKEQAYCVMTKVPEKKEKKKKKK